MKTECQHTAPPKYEYDLMNFDQDQIIKSCSTCGKFQGKVEVDLETVYQGLKILEMLNN